MQSTDGLGTSIQDADSGARTPSFSVVISTRNRPQDVWRCLESLTHVSYPAWDVLIVDQSDRENTETMSTWLEFVDRLPGLTYRHMEEKGVCRARNLGLSLTRGDVVLLLDDDCAATSPGFLHEAAAVLDRHPEAAIAFGCVLAVPYDAARGFIPQQDYPSEQVLRSRHQFQVLKGLTACVCIRRQLASSLAFDVHLGPGSRFDYGGDDVDYGYRALKTGHLIAVSPSFSVDHYGFREYAGGAARRVVKGYMYSLGAQNMKMLRSGDIGALGLIVCHLFWVLVTINFRNLVLRRGPSNIGRYVHYFQGLAASFRYRVDRDRCLYV
ncbi:MAG TPA: glycosyltransferase family 2 protein [Dehalococcoidia bacterium]